MKRSLVVEATGGPLGATIAGANVHDTQLLAAPLEAIGVDRPLPTAEMPQHLCLDKGYDHPTGHETVAADRSRPPMRRIGAEPRAANGEKRDPARRWVVERTLAWRSKCRGLLGRYEKKAVTFLGLWHLAGALSWIRRRTRLIGD